MTITVSLSISEITRRALAMSALTVATDSVKSPLTLDDTAAMQCVAEMILGQFVLDLFPHIVDSSFDDDLLRLELKSPHCLTGAETVSMRLTLEKAATAILMGYVTGTDRYDNDSTEALAAIRTLLNRPGALRLPYLY